MGSASVFPGGGVEATDPAGESRFTAARELFEEAGVLLTDPPAPVEALAELRASHAAGAALAPLLATRGLRIALDSLVPWSHWITPSVEPVRFSARFYVAECPAGQIVSCDDVETVEQVWVTPAEAIVRAGELRLPPPQVHTLWQLMRLPTVADVLAQARAQAATITPILPRLLPGTNGVCLLMPWDPQYFDGGVGDARALDGTPPWATGKSRFELRDDTWQYLHAPVTDAA